MRKIGNGLGEKQIMVLQRGESSGHRERRERVEQTGISTRRALPPMIWDDFHDFFCNQQGSKIGVSEFPWLGWDKTVSTLPYSCNRGRQTPPGHTVQSKDHVSGTGRACFVLFRAHLSEVVLPLWGKKNWWVPFTYAAPQHRCIDTC